MKSFLKNKFWPVLAGLLTAFIIISLFEIINFVVFPIPDDLDVDDLAAIRFFISSLPWTAYILLLLGWILAAFGAGCVTTYLARETDYQLSFVVGIILALFGLLNNFSLNASQFFNLITLAIFIIFTYFGHRYLLNAHTKS